MYEGAVIENNSGVWFPTDSCVDIGTLVDMFGESLDGTDGFANRKPFDIFQIQFAHEETVPAGKWVGADEWVCAVKAVWGLHGVAED